jgi:hypothetical protein
MTVKHVYDSSLRYQFHKTFFIIIYTAISVVPQVMTQVTPLGAEIMLRKVL